MGWTGEVLSAPHDLQASLGRLLRGAAYFCAPASGRVFAALLVAQLLGVGGGGFHFAVPVVHHLAGLRGHVRLGKAVLAVVVVDEAVSE